MVPAISIISSELVMNGEVREEIQIILQWTQRWCQKEVFIFTDVKQN